MLLPGNSITSVDGVRRLRSHLHNYALSFLSHEDQPHSTPVTVLIPVHPKDKTRLVASIAGLRARLAHPIERIILVAPSGGQLRPLAADLGAVVVDEDDVLPDAVLRTDFNGRRGWFRQQFIKLSWPDWLDAEYVLTMDADTKPAQRLRFLNEAGQSILYTSDEYSVGYFGNVQAILGPIQRAPWSFVAHTMLFENTALRRLHHQIARRSGKPWAETLVKHIDPAISQCFSEFELYGNYMHTFERKRVELRYFRNKKVPEALFLQDAVPARLQRFRTLSSHMPHGTLISSRTSAALETPP